MYYYKKMQETYLNDPVFRKVVKMLTQLINECELSPYEIRQAAMFAVMKHEEMNSKPVAFEQFNESTSEF